jgi:hypothetical protein
MALVGLSDHFQLSKQQHRSLVLGAGQSALVAINPSRPWKEVLFRDPKVQGGTQTVWSVEENDHHPHLQLGCLVEVKKRRKSQGVAKSSTVRQRLTLTVEFGADSVW